MDLLFKSLSDATRRDILALVWDVELGAGEIASHFPCVTRSAISQQLTLLKRAGLVSMRREGTYRYYRANRREFLRLEEYLVSFWANSLERLKVLAEARQRNKEEPWPER